MRRVRRFFVGPGVNSTLHEAIEEEANRKKLPNGKWYKVEAIHVYKTNPITDYHVTLDPTPLNQPPP